MLSKNEILVFLKNHLNVLKQDYSVTKIGLFGSFARGEETAKSDIDLLMEFELETKDLFNLKLALKHYLETNLGREVDLCREKYVKNYLKEHLKKEVIYV
ncbi:nucleotidyltransferase family protein [bacterium]|nr:nucleotidyltransferase family protein [bacterium]